MELYFYHEGPPGWAVYHLMSTLAGYMESQGHVIRTFYSDQQSQLDDLYVLCQSNPNIIVCPGNSVSALDLNFCFGIPMKNIFVVFHSKTEMARFKVYGLSRQRWTDTEEKLFDTEWDIDDDFVNLCHQFRAVGYINKYHGEWLCDVKNKFYTPMHADTAMFAPNPQPHEKIRVGMAADFWYHKFKGRKLARRVIEYLRNTPEYEYDDRCSIGLEQPKDRTGLPFSEMPQFFNSLDLWLCTSRVGGEEGLPTPSLQAGACGIPAISTRCGHMPEFVRDGQTGILVHNSLESFVEVFEMLKTNKELIAKMSKEVREHVLQNWSIEATGPRWLRFLTSGPGV
jgi:hypothetical protein